MKKIIMLLVFSLASIFLVACSSEQKKGNEDSENGSITDTNVKGVITSSDKRDSVSLKVIPDKEIEISKGLSVKINKVTKNKQGNNEYITIHYEIKNNTNKSVDIGAGDFEIVNQDKKMQEMFGLLENFGGEVKSGKTLEGDGNYTWNFSSDKGSIKYAPKAKKDNKSEQVASWKFEK